MNPQQATGQAAQTSIFGDNPFHLEPLKFSLPTSDAQALGAMAFSEAKDYTNAAAFFGIESVALNRTSSGGNFGRSGAYAPLIAQLYAKNQFQGVGNVNFQAALQGPDAIMNLKGAGFRTLESYFLAMDTAKAALTTGIPDPTKGGVYMFSGDKEDLPQKVQGAKNLVEIETKGMATWWFWR
jgi:hypothetical protein